jgi:hypothetical protein
MNGERGDGTVARRTAVEQIIETLASGVGNAVGWMAGNGVLFLVFAVLWVALGAGLIWSQGTVDQAWQAIRDLPLVVQIFAWLLFLPVMAGLWVWETGWPLLVRIVVVLGLAGWNLLVFLPRGLLPR